MMVFFFLQLNLHFTLTFDVKLLYICPSGGRPAAFTPARVDDPLVHTAFAGFDPAAPDELSSAHLERKVSEGRGVATSREGGRLATVDSKLRLIKDKYDK